MFLFGLGMLTTSIIAFLSLVSPIKGGNTNESNNELPPADRSSNGEALSSEDRPEDEKGLPLEDRKAPGNQWIN